MSDLLDLTDALTEPERRDLRALHEAARRQATDTIWLGDPEIAHPLDALEQLVARELVEHDTGAWHGWAMLTELGWMVAEGLEVAE
jgi:hypothetical protein